LKLLADIEAAKLAKETAEKAEIERKRIEAQQAADLIEKDKELKVLAMVKDAKLAKEKEAQEDAEKVRLEEVKRATDLAEKVKREAEDKILADKTAAEVHAALA